MKIHVYFLISLFLVSSVAAHSHYTYEHAEEMYYSGRIDWQEYGPKSFEQAIEENKPIFLLISAPSWCYWCHVYTSDDYVYHEDVYPIINEKFIPIYVNADERQDLTRQYLEGGWPSTTVMTPGRERLYGYSGPRPLQNMVTNLNQAASHVQSVTSSNLVEYKYNKGVYSIPTRQELSSIISGFRGYLLQAYDDEHGGFGTGQKFPQSRTLDYALEVYEETKNDDFLALVQNTLENQYTSVDELESNYNLFDPIEGGFHRYGTARDWSPPHYEKMLYDNARLLKTYVHLQSISQNSLVDEVVQKTDDFVLGQWYDSTQGGFYGNSDVHGEHHYYAKNPRPAEKPRVEKTKYTDWNSEAIITYLYLWETTGNLKYKKIAEQTLDFFSKEIVTEQGAYHYYQDGEKGVRGTLLDNAYLLLAFVEAYEVLGDKKYLETAKTLAIFNLDHLYDWHNGGFFERHSSDKELYAPGEHIVLSKPLEENGVISLALLKMYEATDEVVYLHTALTTLGDKINSVSGLDRGYYFIKASELVVDEKLLEVYASHSKEVNLLIENKREDFWLDNVLEEQEGTKASSSNFVESDEGIDEFKGSFLLLVVISLFAGLLSFASPCTLPILPAYLANSLRTAKHTIKAMTLFFFLGLSSVFVLLGVSASLIGNVFQQNIGIFSQVAGAALIIFGVFMLMGRGFSGVKINPKKPGTYFESFVFGAALGVSWTPCVGPILVAILLLASAAGSALKGGILLFVYAVGLALPLVLVSLFLQRINKKGSFWQFVKGKEVSIGSFKIHSTSLISGLIFIILGILMFSGWLYGLNQLFAVTDFQIALFRAEEWLLGFVK